MARPTKRDATQLDDLAAPLLGHVGGETLRYVSAALSQSRYAPPALVRKLADLPIDISAPILVQSPILTAIDLVALIGRHGLPHARAIARRPELDSRILGLIRALGALETASEDGAEPQSTHQSAAEKTRASLRAMMRPARSDATDELIAARDLNVYVKLRTTALTGVPVLFQTALADGLGVDMAQSQGLTEAADISPLLLGLRALDLTEEQAMLILQCVRPERITSLQTICGILEAYGSIDQKDAERVADGWRRSSRRSAPERAMIANDSRLTGALRAS